MRGVLALLFGTIVVLLLRSTALTAFAARGVVLDVLAFAVVIWALRHGAGWGSSFGFALGLFADLDASHWLGRHALVLTLLGYVVGRLADTLVREDPRTQLVLLFVATAIHQAWVVCFELGGLASWPYLMARVAFAALATAPIGTLLLMIARRASGRPLFGDVTVAPGKAL